MLVFVGYIVGLAVLNPCWFCWVYSRLGGTHHMLVFVGYIVGLEVLTRCCFLLGI